MTTGGCYFSLCPCLTEQFALREKEWKNRERGGGREVRRGSTRGRVGKRQRARERESKRAWERESERERERDEQSVRVWETRKTLSGSAVTHEVAANSPPFLLLAPWAKVSSRFSLQSRKPLLASCFCVSVFNFLVIFVVVCPLLFCLGPLPQRPDSL